jgi:hypothetical protein
MARRCAYCPTDAGTTQRCHLIHDRPRHLRQRWLTCRRRYALGDLFLGIYAELSSDLTAAVREAAGLPTA